MVKTIFTLLVFAAAGWALSSDETSSMSYSQDVNLFLSSGMAGAEIFQSEGSALASSVFPPDPVSLPIIRAEVQEVSLILTVTDRHGHFVRNLMPSDFTIHDNGEQPEKVTNFESQSELPLRLAIVIDRSDSAAYALSQQKRSAAAFLKRILRRDSDLGLIIGFNQDVQLVQEPANDAELLSHAIQTLRSGGETAIYDAVAAACQQLAKVRDTQPVRRVIILMTDGEDNRSHIDLEQAEEVAQRNECVVYVINISYLMSINAGIDSELQQADRAMKELSEVTGGNFLRVRAEGLSTSFVNIEKELRSQYLISYKPAHVRPDGSFHRLVVLGPKKLRIHHRDGYFAR
ncbi:MAG TPA: VWA domain-containing protein [Terriglobales bacterium]|jgi:Ca-activated chloride channel family protein|nr:VWA domain-containing protein [Terriglobales bacterium]